jgi:hypothetical protein
VIASRYLVFGVSEVAEGPLDRCTASSWLVSGEFLRATRYGPYLHRGLVSSFALLVCDSLEEMFACMLPLPARFSFFSAMNAAVGLDPDEGMPLCDFRGSRLFVRFANSPYVLH